MGGAILTGETSLQGILREIREELGITFSEDEAIFFKSIKTNDYFKDIYLFKKDIDIQDITFEDKEAIDAKWVNIDEYMKMFKNNEIVPNVDFGLKEYKECLRIINNL